MQEKVEEQKVEIEKQKERYNRAFDADVDELFNELDERKKTITRIEKVAEDAKEKVSYLTQIKDEFSKGVYK